MIAPYYNKICKLLLVMLLGTMCFALPNKLKAEKLSPGIENTSQADRTSQNNDDMFLAIVGTIFAVGIIGLGIAIASFVLISIFGLIFMGALSASVLVGLSKKSLEKGFETFVIMLTTLLSCAFGVATFWFSNQLLLWTTANQALLTGAIAGMVVGFVLGLILVILIQKLTKFLISKLNN